MAKFIRFLGPDGPTYGRVEDDVVYTLSGDLFAGGRRPERVFSWTV